MPVRRAIAAGLGRRVPFWEESVVGKAATLGNTATVTASSASGAGCAEGRARLLGPRAGGRPFLSRFIGRRRVSGSWSFRSAMA